MLLRAVWIAARHEFAEWSVAASVGVVRAVWTSHEVGARIVGEEVSFERGNGRSELELSVDASARIASAGCMQRNYAAFGAMKIHKRLRWLWIECHKMV